MLTNSQTLNVAKIHSFITFKDKHEGLIFKQEVLYNFIWQVRISSFGNAVSNFKIILLVELILFNCDYNI